MGRPTDAEEEDHQVGRLRDYEVEFVVSRCGIDSRKLGWKGYIVVNVNIDESFVCALCKRLTKGGK
jgi:hypothetical protein